MNKTVKQLQDEINGLERELIKSEYAFDLYAESTKDMYASMNSRLMLANIANSKLRQTAKAGWATVAILVVVVGWLL